MRLEISCQDRLGIAQDVLDILVEHKIDLRGIEIDETGKIFLNFPTIEFDDFQHLMPKIRRIDGIEDVKTTAFMPVEREKHQLRAILQTLPDPVFSIDRKGQITQINDAIEAGLGVSQAQILGADIGDFIRGFNFQRWLDKKEVLAQALKLKFLDQDYLADILPIFIHDSHEDKILAGAVVMLKSEVRLGQQISAFNRSQSDNFGGIVAQSVSMKRLVEHAKQVASSEHAILILGEDGCGKHALAKACHYSSSGAAGPCETLTTAGKSEQELATELFGEFGNGDIQPGLLARAVDGTLIIHDVAELPISIQARLTRVMDSGEYTCEGSSDVLTIKTRIIACTSFDLQARAESGDFRQDLLLKLMTMSLVLPPLRERRADILPLADTFIQQHCITLGRHRVRLPKSASDFIVNYPWPGNVKQLENTLLRALTVEKSNELTIDSLQLPTNATTVNFVDENFEGSLDQEVKKFEKALLQRLYPFYPSTRQLAKKLGLSHTAIANKLRDYGISRGGLK